MKRQMKNGTVMQWLSLLHIFIKLSLNSGFSQVQTLVAACLKFALVRISGKWSRLEIRLNDFRLSTIPQKQFTIIIKSFHLYHVCQWISFDKAVIHTVDTDVVVFGLKYQAFIDCRIFIHLGCRSKKRLLELKNTELSRELCIALPGLDDDAYLHHQALF